MSNSTNSAQGNEPVKHNVYFEGAVQSLGLLTEKGKATIGVMKKGTYTFSTGSAEEMVVISGMLNVKLEAGSNYVAYGPQQKFDVAANSSFEVNCDADVAYLCYYE
jgi:uncharacterized protein YaiE (UPF0345 family)